MKVGLLTYHASINPGAFWQCFATCQLLRRLGHEPVVLDYRNPRYHSWNPFVAAKRLKNWIAPRSLFWLVRAQFRHRRDLGMLPLSEPMANPTPRDLPLDALVVGSDVVWSHPFDPVFFGQTFRCPKTVAYAASMGGKAGDSVRIPDFLRNPTPFASISCRDGNTMALLGRCHPSWRDGAVLLNDPTVTLEVPDALRTPVREKAYCLLYVSESFSKPEIAVFKLFCKRRGLTPVSLFYPHPGMENHPFASAGFSMRLILNASLVVTNAFHGALLSRIHGVPVVFMARNGVVPFKAREQFSRLAISECVASSTDDLDRVSGRAESLPAIGSVLPPLAEANIAFLGQSLGR